MHTIINNMIEKQNENKNSNGFIPSTSLRGFTIVELIVVISIIGILAGISIVSYGNWQKSLIQAQLKSDLNGAATAMESYRNFNNGYPLSVPSTFTPSAGVTMTGGSYGGDKTYCIDAVNSKYPGVSYYINSTHSGVDAQEGDCVSVYWLVIGTQTWAKYNLNVGTMVTGVTEQTNNSILEKYCYDNLESNCTTYGGLYQWDEAMKYVSTPIFPAVAQGICPTGSHIPTDAEWKTLEMSLSGMLQATADTTGWRGTDEGTKLKSGGSSGLNMPLAGVRYTDGSFGRLSFSIDLWSSSESGANAWYRSVYSGFTSVYRDTPGKAHGFFVRCLGN